MHSWFHKTKQFRLTLKTATQKNLSDVLNEGTKVLHYSGHGELDYLAFEGENGAVHRMQQSALDEMMDVFSKKRSRLQLVFLSACHSERIGRDTFVRAGVPHVVAVDASSKVDDKLIIEFTSEFYRYLLKGSPVEEAFRVANLHAKTGQHSSKWTERKFLLLPEGVPHSDVLFSNLKDGVPSALKVENKQHIVLPIEHEGPCCLSRLARTARVQVTLY
jgi:hypothetical protein